MADLRAAQPLDMAKMGVAVPTLRQIAHASNKLLKKIYLQKQI